MEQGARKAVVAGLIRAEKAGYSNLLLTSVLENTGQGARERNFAAALFYGTLERQVTLDAILAPFLKKPIEKLDAEVRMVLRTGLYQLRYMAGVPPHAAVNEAVNLCRKLGKTSAAGLVNSVLRKAQTADIPQAATPQKNLAARCSVHESIAALTAAQFQERAAEVLETYFEKPVFTVRVNTLKTTKEELAAALTGSGIEVADAGFENALFLPGGSAAVLKLGLFANGFFHVQGLASQAAVALLAPKPGQKVLDLCAAPGGKAATIGQYMQNNGSLTCLEIQKSRIPLLAATLDRLGVKAKVEQADAAVLNTAFNDVDAVLCDVPCSGLGIMHKKPDIRLKDVSDLSGLIALQKAILQTAAAYPKIGGHIVYSTCTYNADENEEQVKAFLEEHKNYRLWQGEYPLAGFKNTGYGMLYTPAKGKDGFFMARLERVM